MFSNITINRLDSSSTDERYLVVAGDSYFETNALTASLLSALSASESREEGIRRFLSEHEGYSYEQIDSVVEQSIVPKLTAAPEQQRQFLYQRQLVAPHWIDAITSRLAVMFDRRLMVVLLSLAAVATTCFFTLNDNVLAFGNRVDSLTLIGLMAFVVCSSMWHEIGHASAIKHYGLRHGAIGFGLYLNFPVLYTDVTAAWQLPRRQRYVVNIAGVYFQSIVLTVLIGIYFATGSDVVRYMVLMMVLGFILTLNPFFKFDGYWMATDLLGVANLRRKTQALFSYWIKRIVGRKAAAPALLSEITGKMRVAVIAYAVTVNLFMLYYFCYIIPMFIRSFVAKFPDEFMRLITCLSNNIMPPMALLRNLGSQLLFMGLIIYLLYRFIAGNLYKYFPRRD